MALSGGPWRPYGIQGLSSTVEDGEKCGKKSSLSSSVTTSFMISNRPVADWGY